MITAVSRLIFRICFTDSLINLFQLILHIGLPPPSVDVIAILKNPSLSNKPLYGVNVTTKSKQYNELEAFCKAMGWTLNDGVVPTKPIEVKRKNYNQWIEEDVIDMTNVHETYTKTDVKKEMENCRTKGIEKQRAIEVLSDRKAAKLRKVIYIYFSFWMLWCARAQ